MMCVQGPDSSTLRRIVSALFWTLLLLFCSSSALPAQALAADAPPKSITVVLDDNYPPFIFRNSSGQLQGILNDTWALWQARTGIVVNLQAMDWAQAQQMMQAGQADVIDTVFETEARRQLYDFSAPYAQIAVPIFFHHSISGIVNADSLKGFTVGVKAGDACIDVLHAHGIDSLKKYSSYSGVIAAAASSDVRVFCVDQPPAVYLLNQLGIEKDFRHSIPLYTGEFHRAVHKGDTALLKVIEDGFARISAPERAQIERKWYGSAIEGTGVGVYARYVSYALIGALLVAAVLALWNRLLRRQVTVRTADIARKHEALQASESENRALISVIPDLIFTNRRDGEYLAVHAADPSLLAAPPEAFLHRRVDEILPALLTDLFMQAFARALDSHTLQELTYALTVGDRERHFEARVVPASADTVITIVRDISARKAAEDEINTLVYFDPLTRLPNRRLLLDRLRQAMVSSSRSGHFFALLFIDLDNFKTINDTLGHEKGDLLLQQVAQRLLTCVREYDTVARLGGDEFVVLLEDLSENTLLADTQTKTVAKNILSKLGQTYQIANEAQRSTPSIGVNLFVGQQEDINELLKRAELAMYQAKASGRNTLQFFDPQMQAEVTARAVLEADLHEAVRQNQFALYYQAQVKGDGEVSGVEALVRWQHPVRGLVPPLEFIALSEETGLILPLGNWVLEAACAQLVLWAAQPAMADLTVAVNVSARQFHQSDYVSQVLQVLKRTGANPQRLKLELTESLLVTHIEDVIGKMHALKDIGIGFSLDDFGTGYSSLSYLKRLPLDQLKIDQGFVRDILNDANDAAIAKMVIALADTLGLTVIAEGVETQPQRDFLASLGCHAYQGYLFSRPLPRDAFETFFRSQAPGKVKCL